MACTSAKCVKAMVKDAAAKAKREVSEAGKALKSFDVFGTAAKTIKDKTGK